MKLHEGTVAREAVTLNGGYRSFEDESKLLLKLLTNRHSQIKIRAFFVEMRASTGIVRIYCQLNVPRFRKRNVA